MTILKPTFQSLKLDFDTGEVTLMSNKNLDREEMEEFVVTIEARDDLGNGNLNTTELYVKILDINGTFWHSGSLNCCLKSVLFLRQSACVLKAPLLGINQGGSKRLSAPTTSDRSVGSMNCNVSQPELCCSGRHRSN